MEATAPSEGLADWESVHDAWSLGRLGDAALHTERALRASLPGSLLAAAHATNQAALSNEHRRAPPLPPTQSDCSVDSLFVRELLLSRSYNYALSLARSGNVAAGLVELELCDDALLGIPSPSTLCAHGRSVLPDGTLFELVQRVCDAAVEAFQLRGVLALLQSDYHGADSANALASSWHRAGAALVQASPVAKSAPSVTVAGERDRTEARGACLKSLAYACTGDFFGAARVVHGYVQLCDDSSDIAPFWPVIYQSAAFRAYCALETDAQDNGAVLQLEHCARAGYRQADSYALAARLHNVSSRALLSFQSALALDHERPASLFAAANTFACAGEHDAQIELLSCLRELVGAEAVSTVIPVGILELSKPWTPLRAVVDIELSRALVLDDKPADALAVLDRVPATHEIAERRLIAAAASAALEDTDNATDCAVRFALDYPRSTAAQLMLADARLCSGDVSSAYDSLKRINIGVGDDVVCAALRGISYNNFGVLMMCGAGENTKSGVDGLFAAAQVAFDKSAAAAAADEGSVSKATLEWIRNAADSSSWNRMLAMMERGRLEDAASHWIARRMGRRIHRGLEASFGKPTSHVMGMVDNAKKKAMDQFCKRVEQASNNQRQLDNLMRHVASRMND